MGNSAAQVLSPNHQARPASQQRVRPNHQQINRIALADQQELEKRFRIFQLCFAKHSEAKELRSYRVESKIVWHQEKGWICLLKVDAADYGFYSMNIGLYPVTAERLHEVADEHARHLANRIWANQNPAY